MTSREVLKKIRELYKLSAQTISASIRQQRRKELVEALSNLSESDRASLSKETREWIIGQEGNN